MDPYLGNINKLYVDADNVQYYISPSNSNDVQEINFTFIQTEGKCSASIVVEPMTNSKSKVKINIFAENNAEVDCVCKLYVDVGGSETDVQIRSWPFDSSKIKARPEMRIYNSDVVATHGNALGTLKPQEQYYLATKGIDNYKELIKTSLLHEKL